MCFRAQWQPDRRCIGERRAHEESGLFDRAAQDFNGHGDSFEWVCPCGNPRAENRCPTFNAALSDGACEA
jgi:hypothetical protein